MVEALYQRIWTGLIARRKIVITASIWIALVMLTQWYMAENGLTFPDLANQIQDVLRNSPYGFSLYLLMYFIRPVLLIPASLLTVLGGVIFGLWPGFLYVFFAGMLSAVLPYTLGWWTSSDEIPQPAKDGLSIHRFTKMLQKKPFQTVLIMRLIYLPYDLVNVLAGNLRINFLIFILATGLGNLAGVFSFVSIGASLEGNLTSGEWHLKPETLILSSAILVCSVFISFLFQRFKTSQSNGTPEELE